MTGNDDRLDADVRTDAEICAALQSELRDARAEIERLIAVVAAMDEDADQALIEQDEAVEAESAAGDRIIATLRAELERLTKLHERDARNLSGVAGGNMSGYTVAEVEAVESELAAERAKVERVEALLDAVDGVALPADDPDWDPIEVPWTVAVRAALTGGDR